MDHARSGQVHLKYCYGLRHLIQHTDNGNIGRPEKSSHPNGKESNRKAKFVIVPCTIPKESICFYFQEKGHWLRSCPDYLKDLRKGRVEKFDSASGKSTV